MDPKSSIEVFQKEWEDMALHLSTHVPAGNLRDKLEEQLIWLKGQLVYFEESRDYDQLKAYFNEVVDSINFELHLNRKERFRNQ